MKTKRWFAEESMASSNLARIMVEGTREEIGAVHIESALLVAAAPQLLAALKECLYDDAGDLEPATVHLAMEAIAAAEGTSEGENK